MCDENKQLRELREEKERAHFRAKGMGIAGMPGPMEYPNPPAFSVDKTRETIAVAQRIRIAIEGVPLRTAERAMSVVFGEIEAQQR